MTFDVTEVRKDFPILTKKNRGKPLAYLDNAASTQKPRTVIEKLSKFYCEQNSNVHRGVYALAEEAENEYHKSRETIANWLGVNSDEIIFVRGATEGLNLIANCLSKGHLKDGDGIILTDMEHHANIVPWQLIAKEKNLQINTVSVKDDGSLDLDELDQYIANENTKILSLCHISNSLGTKNPVESIIEKAHARNISVVLDGAQSAPHTKLNLKNINCDFFTFSGHKVFGPMGIGIVYGKKEILEKLPPYQGGGDMIDQVSFKETTFAPSPQKFEAGTPNVSGAIGLAEAITYFSKFEISELSHHENLLLETCQNVLSEIDGCHIYGKTQGKAAVLSFTIDGIHMHDLASLLDSEGIAIRTGHHCCQPLMEVLGIPGTARASFAFYNNFEEAERFVLAVEKAVSILR